MVNKILESIKSELEKNNIEFFKYAWRDNITNLLTAESRYDKLIKWINNEIEQRKIAINVFNPADKTETYSKQNFNTYIDALKDFAFLVNMKEILCHDKCTSGMRYNVEYAICKYFNINYIETMHQYC